MWERQVYDCVSAVARTDGTASSITQDEGTRVC